MPIPSIELVLFSAHVLFDERYPIGSLIILVIDEVAVQRAPDENSLKEFKYLIQDGLL